MNTVAPNDQPSNDARPAPADDLESTFEALESNRRAARRHLERATLLIQDAISVGGDFVDTKKQAAAVKNLVLARELLECVRFEVERIQTVIAQSADTRSAAE